MVVILPPHLVTNKPANELYPVFASLAFSHSPPHGISISYSFSCSFLLLLFVHQLHVLYIFFCCVVLCCVVLYVGNVNVRVAVEGVRYCTEYSIPPILAVSASHT